MGIRTKLLLSTAIIGILALIATFVVADKIVMSSFSNLEKRETERNWWRASDAINRRVKSMVESSHGWAVSNDAHQFLLGKNPTYSKTKFGNSAIAGMGLDAVFFIKKNRSIAHGKFSKKSLLRNITPQSFLTDIQLPKLNTKKPDPSGGLVRHDGQLLVYSARAVTDSKGKAEPSGWMVWIQHLSPEMIKSLAFELDLQVKISPKVHEFKDLVKLDLIGDSQVSGTGHLLGIDEKPVGSLTVYDKRDIYAVGQSTIQLVHIGIIGLITLAMFGISAGIQRNVISRLFSLNTQLGAVNTVTGEGSIQIPGQDEISKVGESLNTMLTKIADSAAEIEMQKSELVGINENLESIIAERTRKLASMNAVLQYALDGIAELTPSGQVVQANATLAKIFGMDELANVSFIELFSSGEKIWNHIVAHLEYHSRLDMNLDAKTVDGSIIHLQAVFVSEGTEQGGLTAIHVFLKDVTEHKQIEQDMVFQAKHDMLTGLTNRRGFVEALERNLKDTDEPCAILFVDLDNFKYINDSKGHDVGDGLLVEVTKILRQVAPANTTLGRLGGDEFVILAPEYLRTRCCN